MTTYSPAEVETIVFSGIKFRRYPNSKRLHDRNYYRPAANYIKAGIGYLHREIWRTIHGEIPDGYDIHHKDENPLNNRPDNLVCLSKSDHAKLHAETMPEWKRRWIAKQLDTNARPKAIAWHQSDEGREWHSQHGKTVMNNRTLKEYVCEYCGDTYQSKNPSKNRFCSNVCRSAARRATKQDDIEKVCENCGVVFRSNRYDKTICCGNPCAAKLRWKRRKQA